MNNLFNIGDEVIVYSESYPDKDEHGFSCIKLSDGQCLHRNNVLIIDKYVDDKNIKCRFKKFREDQPLRECIVPVKYIRHTAKNIPIDSKVKFLPQVRCLQSGKVGILSKVGPTPESLQVNDYLKNELTYWFIRDDEPKKIYPCRSHELIDISNDVLKSNFSERLNKLI